PSGLVMVTTRRSGSPEPFSSPPGSVDPSTEPPLAAVTPSGVPLLLALLPGGRLVDQLPDGLARAGLAQLADEAVVAHGPHDGLQGAQVVAGAVLRGDEQDNHVDRLAVDGIERDAPRRDANGPDQPVHAG